MPDPTPVETPSRFAAVLPVVALVGASLLIGFSLWNAKQRRRGRAQLGPVRAPLATGKLRGTLKITVVDAKTKQPTPAVVGVYPADGSLAQLTPTLLHGFAFWPVEATQPKVAFPKLPAGKPSGNVLGMPVSLPGWGKGNDNRGIAGRTSAWLRAGPARVLVFRGFEYKPIWDRVNVRVGATISRTYRLERLVDMPALGWYSGDDHVHLRRDRDLDPEIVTALRAVDVHVGHVLQMGNIVTGDYFAQYAFGSSGWVHEGATGIVSGQENPRTNLFGHAIGLAATKMVHDPSRYVLYDETFSAVRKAGGITGYAHFVDSDEPRPMVFRTHWGAALDVPAGLVDFVEIIQGEKAGFAAYHQWLDLGYRLIASAGSDFPWSGVIGQSRVYAKVDGDTFTLDGWLGAFRAGRTFATNGPMLLLSVQGAPPGSTLEVKKGTKLSVELRVIWPRALAGVEEVRLAGVVDRKIPIDLSTGDARWQGTVEATRSGWLAAYTKSGSGSYSHTTPVYVLVDGEKRSWIRERVPAHLATWSKVLDEIAALDPVKAGFEKESATHAFTRQREVDVAAKHVAAIRARVTKARAQLNTLRRAVSAAR